MADSNGVNTDFESSREVTGITIRLDAFEGPLDLLLHLIKKDEIDIGDIPISRITEQYLEYLEIMKDLNINVAGEWLVMAATLIHIKSRMLLPTDPNAETIGDEHDDPRQELVYQLLEHQKFRNAAEMLYTREELENAVWHKTPSDVLEDGREVIAVTLFDLVRAFHEIVERFAAHGYLEVSQEEITVEQKLDDLRRYFLVHDTLNFSTYFSEAESKLHLIVMFLALLEMVRLREVLVYQKKPFDDIYLTRLKETA